MIVMGFAMRRLGNARTILEIETIAEAARGGAHDFHWLAHGVECSRAGHRYSGPDYSLTIDVLSLRQPRARGGWHVLLVSEMWRSGALDLRTTRWLKLLAGRPPDVLHWLAAHGDPAINAKETTP